MGKHKLNARKIESIKKTGTYADGGNLYLRVQVRNGRTSKSWVFRWVRDGKVFERGLGALDVRSLAEARTVAAELRKALYHGRHPDELLQRRRVKGKTFADCAAEVTRKHQPYWKNGADAQQWEQTLRDYVLPVLGNKAPAEITAPEVLSVLKPIWETKPSVAARARRQIEAVLDYAAMLGLRPEGSNPARWKGQLALALPPPRKVRRVRHYAAADWRDVPALYARLSESGDTKHSLCLRFLALTAVRSNEARGARWDEINLEAAVWAIPGERMKSGKPHRVPLSPAAIDLLKTIQPWSRNGLVFPGQGTGAVDRTTLLRVLQKLAPGVTVHGFRSSFRVWAEESGYASSVAEAALAHTNPNAVEAAYQRSDLFERRRELMDAWAEFVTGRKRDG